MHMLHLAPRYAPWREKWCGARHTANLNVADNPTGVGATTAETQAARSEGGR